jgi:hypothetical protein
MKTILVAGIGVATGMIVANYLTNGAVMDAASDVLGNVKDRFLNKSATAIEVASDAVEDASNTVIDSIETL